MTDKPIHLITEDGEKFVSHDMGKRFDQMISREDWEEAGIVALDDMTPSEKRREKCRQKETERGVRRINDNVSIVPGSLVEELRERLEAGENVIIACGEVITCEDLRARKFDSL